MPAGSALIATHSFVPVAIEQAVAGAHSRRSSLYAFLRPGGYRNKRCLVPTVGALAATHSFVAVAIETSAAKRCHVPTVGGIHRRSWKTDHHDYQRVARDKTSVPEDVSNTFPEP